jgi:subfamily B ATP-binding cassette protein MsbA
LVSRASNDIAEIQAVLSTAPVSLLRQAITLVGGVLLMGAMNWQLTLIVLSLIPPLALLSIFYGRRLKHLAVGVQDRLADATVALEEIVSGIRVVKSFDRESYERTRYSNEIAMTVAATMQRARMRAILAPIVAFLGFAAITFLLWFGGRQVIQGTVTPGELVAFLIYMVVVSAPLGEAAGLWGRMQEALGAGQRIFEIMDNAPEEDRGYSEQDIARARKTFQGHVHFINVSFTYTPSSEDEHPGPAVLHDLHLEAHPGEIIALVGYSGSGKTTLVNLLPRFYEPTAGRIEIDGQDIRQIPLRHLRSQIGLVPQETFLFGGAVRENIAYGRLDASEAEIRAAAEAAYAHEFIVGLPNGYDTLVGEKGIKLSAGQRQRIAIARALLKDPAILILDEATSALDSESERWVQAALARLMEGRTSFVIAHRLSTIQRAHSILVLDKGRIVEQGNHEELLTRNGLYRRLVEMQLVDIGKDDGMRR